MMDQANLTRLTGLALMAIMVYVTSGTTSPGVATLRVVLAGANVNVTLPAWSATMRLRALLLAVAVLIVAGVLEETMVTGAAAGTTGTGPGMAPVSTMLAGQTMLVVSWSGVSMRNLIVGTARGRVTCLPRTILEDSAFLRGSRNILASPGVRDV